MTSDVIHIRTIRVIRVQHIPRGIFWCNTNSTDYTNTWQTMSYAFGIFVKSVFNIYHAENFDGTRIIRVHLPLGITNPGCRTTTRCQPWAMRHCPLRGALENNGTAAFSSLTTHCGSEWPHGGVKMIIFGGQNDCIWRWKQSLERQKQGRRSRDKSRIQQLLSKPCGLRRDHVGFGLW